MGRYFKGKLTDEKRKGVTNFLYELKLCFSWPKIGFGFVLLKGKKPIKSTSICARCQGKLQSHCRKRSSLAKKNSSRAW